MSGRLEHVLNSKETRCQEELSLWADGGFAERKVGGIMAHGQIQTSQAEETPRQGK